MKEAALAGLGAVLVTGLLILLAVRSVERPDSPSPPRTDAAIETQSPAPDPSSAPPESNAIGGLSAPRDPSMTPPARPTQQASATPVRPTPLTVDGQGVEVVCTDGTGDVTNIIGSIPEPKMPGTDLSEVRVALGTEAITITFTATDLIPIDAGPSPLGGEASIVWYVLTRSGDQGAYLLQAELWGSHWYSDAVDLVAARRSVPAERSEQRSRRFPRPFTRGKSVVAVFTRADLPNLTVPFTWTAGTEWADLDVYGDACPDRAAGGLRDASSHLIAPGRLP